MYCLIFILKGLLIMMGQHARSETLFYYFTLEEYIPENHLLRLIDKHISFAFVRERLKEATQSQENHDGCCRPAHAWEAATV